MTEIDVSCISDQGKLILVWQDNGVGISKEKKEKIFERGVGDATGLGLSLLRGILSLTGIIILENWEPGMGARFEITIPKQGVRHKDSPGYSDKNPCV